jgi:hypothetical protein
MNYSLRTLLLVAALLCIVCASLVYAGPMVGELYYTAGLLTIAFGLIAAFYQRGIQRAFWIGFLVLFGIYFGHAMWPIELRTAWIVVSHEGGFRAPGLFTTHVLTLCFGALHGLGGDESFIRATNPDITTERYIAFLNVGHTVIAFVLGIVGGRVAQHLAVRVTPLAKRPLEEVLKEMSKE